MRSPFNLRPEGKLRRRLLLLVSISQSRDDGDQRRAELLHGGHEAQIARFERKRLHEFANEAGVRHLDRANPHDGRFEYCVFGLTGGTGIHAVSAACSQRDSVRGSTTSKSDARSKSLGMRWVASAVAVRFGLA